MTLTDQILLGYADLQQHTYVEVAASTGVSLRAVQTLACRLLGRGLLVAAPYYVDGRGRHARHQITAAGCALLGVEWVGQDQPPAETSVQFAIRMQPKSVFDLGARA